MRAFWFLLFVCGASAKPPTLSTEQHAWLVGWMSQLDVSSQDHALVWDYYERRLLDGDIDINPPWVDPAMEPMLSEPTCDNLQDGISTKAKACRDAMTAEGDCRDGVPITQDPESICAAEISSAYSCKLQEEAMREDYRKGCQGRHPPKH